MLPSCSTTRARARALALATTLALATPCASGAQSAADAIAPRGAAELAQLVDGLGMTARVLVIGAHPDDEDTRLIAYLARGRHAETAYLSLTRGDGGQNLIGNELGEALGAIRTEELLAARRIDGGHQYFTRAFDFGFSKTADETFRHWPHEVLLGDVVHVVRAFQPQVIIAIFSGTPADGHGHHQASGILAREAYDAAVDTVRFPVREYGRPWSVAKFYRNTSYRGAETATLRYNAGAYDPLLGRSYAEIAAISRSQHKSQGQGGLVRKGVSIVSMRREATRVNEATPATQERDLFDGIDTTLARVRGRPGTPSAVDVDALARDVAAVQRAFDPRRPESVVAPLGVAFTRQPFLTRLGGGPATNLDATRTLSSLTRRMWRAYALGYGLDVEAEVPREVVTTDDSVPVTITVYNRGTAPAPVEWLSAGAMLPSREGRIGPERDRPYLLQPDSALRRTFTLAAGAGPDSMRFRAPSEPDWLRVPRTGDLFTGRYVGVDETDTPIGGEVRGIAYVGLAPRLLGPSDRVANDDFVPLYAPMTLRVVDPVRGEIDRPLAVAPAISVTLDRAVQYARANVPLDRIVTVRLRGASTAAKTVTVRVQLPNGLSADSASRTVTLAGYGATAAVDFRVRGTLPVGRVVIRASAESDGQRFAAGYQLVDYEHIRPQRLYRAAQTAVEAVDIALPARAIVGYVPGVSDNVAPALADLGLAVTVLDSTALGGAELSRYTHIVVGPRAYETNGALTTNNARLLAWVRRGGTMVVQYGQYEMTRPGIMPYPITLGRPAQRVTIEEAPVTVLDPAAAVLRVPNRIGATDWAGWVQERSTYMPQTADPRYRTALAMNDPGEAPNPNGVLIAPLGRGTYVYVTLALFRQLPAGVPGAARLMANLLAARAASVSASAEQRRDAGGP